MAHGSDPWGERHYQAELSSCEVELRGGILGGVAYLGMLYQLLIDGVPRTDHGALSGIARQMIAL
jgi:hypothetical protein